MADTGAYIRNVRSLEQLNNMIEYSGEAMANIEENVSNYINGVKDVLEKQLAFIRKKLEEAEEKLREAEDDLASCEASQSYDEESGEVTPSCRLEEIAVESARREVEEWRRKYEEGKRILGECQQEIEDYNCPGGILDPPGGHCLILNMREKQTPKASQLLRDCIDKLRDILNSDVGADTDMRIDYVPEDRDKPLSDEERSDAFKKKIQGIKDEQELSAYNYKIKDANRAMRCPNCGRSIPLCICKNLHADVNLYQ